MEPRFRVTLRGPFFGSPRRRLRRKASTEVASSDQRLGEVDSRGAQTSSSVTHAEGSNARGTARRRLLRKSSTDPASPHRRLGERACDVVLAVGGDVRTQAPPLLPKAPPPLPPPYSDDERLSQEDEVGVVVASSDITGVSLGNRLGTPRRRLRRKVSVEDAACDQMLGDRDET